MSVLVESLRRLYIAGKVTKKKLQTMKSENKITQAEYDYITGES